ncbi:MAG: PQQ-binding-like beta-propeller repeat protein [Proteobacteria bacterium]|nr:PQQ-binding-like beta-propeller repeat protein [Pseudomonadota bacterium]
MAKCSRLHLLVAGSAVITLALAACGGGGDGSGTGGNGGGGGGGTTATISVNPTQLNVAANGDTSSAPTGQITVTVTNPSGGDTYIGADYTKSAITAITLQAAAGVGYILVSFKDPSTINPGKYSDTIQVGLCTDSTCTQLQSGSVHTVAVTYTVTVDATVTLTANPTTVGAGLPTTLTWTSTHSQSCTASGDWSGTLAPSGTQAVTPATAAIHTYSISCGNPGTIAQASVTVTANAPSLAFSAFPPKVTLGKPVTLRWNGQYAASCVASGDWTGSLQPSGFQTLTLSTQGTTNYHLVCSNAGGSDQKDASVTVVAAPTSPPATAYRMNEAHDGVLITSTGAPYPSQAAPTWTRNLGQPVSYPLIVNGKVYVTTAEPNSGYGSLLYALDATTGATVWGPISVAGVYFGSGLTYDNGHVIVLMFDGGVHAFDASTGAVQWTAQLPGYWYDATPNAYGGTVYISGNAGLSAIDEATGNILWTASSGGTTDWGSPAISSEGVYVQEGYACNANAFDPAFGANLWHSISQCNTPWGYASVVKNGTFFGRVGASLNLFNSETGVFKTQVGSALAPAITATAIIAVNSGTLSSTRLSDLVQTWTYTGPSTLITAPVVVNNTVFAGASDGNVYAVDVTTGAQVWKGTPSPGVSADSENGGPMPPSGPGAGEGLLVFPAGNSLAAWQLQ